MLKLVSFGEEKIDVIKALREIFALGLKDAKVLAESAPVNLSPGTSPCGVVIPPMEDGYDDKNAYMLLMSAGASVELCDVDAEVEVMLDICQSMTRISPEAQDRVACWVYDRWGRPA